MNLLTVCRLPFYAFAAAFGLSVLAAPMTASLAQAFTIDYQSNTNSDGSAKYVDPAARFSGSGDRNSGQTTIRQGDTTLQFGGQSSFNRRYSNDRMFEPIGRPLGER